MKTRLILAGIAALLTAPLVANAADLPQPYKAQPGIIAPIAPRWSGFYVGINGGYAFGTSKWDFPAISPDPKGGLVGGTVGYNFQTGTWVWGLEGDLDWADIKGDATCYGAGSCTTKNDWLGTARLRLGYAGWNNWLPYITGGAAFGDVKAESPLGTASKTQIGWTAGVGLEYAFLGHWSAKIEYLYADLGKFDCGTACSPITPDDVSYKANLVRLGLNYRF